MLITFSSINKIKPKKKQLRHVVFIRITWCCLMLNQQPAVRNREPGQEAETINDKRFALDYWALHLFYGHTSSSAGLPGVSSHPAPRPGSWEGGRDNSSCRFIQAWEMPPGASLTNCPCLAAWESGDCGNCIFSSNCICHMWVLRLWSRVQDPSQWCVKANSWTLTCTTRKGCARRGLQRGQ